MRKRRNYRQDPSRFGGIVVPADKADEIAKALQDGVEERAKPLTEQEKIEISLLDELWADAWRDQKDGEFCAVCGHTYAHCDCKR